MIYYSTKVIELGSCAFRQPFAKSHCKFLHGYRLVAKFTFACTHLDANNWVVDFGAAKELKSILEHMFDHTTVVWSKDPQIELFKTLNERGVIDLRVMEDGVGIEKFAEYCLHTAQKWVSDLTNGRCWVKNVEIWEHEKNSAKVKVGNPTFSNINQSLINEITTPQPTITNNLPQSVETAAKVETTPTPVPVERQTKNKQPIPAPVGNVVDKENNLSFKKALDGLKWGSQSK